MTLRRRAAAFKWAPLFMPTAIASAIAVIACGSGDAGSFLDGTSSSGNPADGSTSFTDGGSFDPTADAAAVGSVSGIVILHAATFPAFRLCFENYPDIAPQPDDTVMPEANVVGVEVGSVVRIGQLDKAPGKVYVFDRRKLRTAPGDPPKACKKVIAESTKDLEYHEVGPLSEPLGVGHVDLLALTGCADSSRLAELNAPSTECTNWDPVKGSLSIKKLSLFPSFAATTKSLPVQLVHMSEVLEAQRGGNNIEVTFGDLDGGAGNPLAQKVATAPTLFDATAPPVTLMVDQSESEAVYGSHGFRIVLRPTTGGTPSFSVDQTLAEVQELSSPSTLPTTYYLAASNYVLLLLGDPRIQPKFLDGGANPSFNPRRAVHLLAVPVKDPEAEDAGAVTPVNDDSGLAADQ